MPDIIKVKLIKSPVGRNPKIRATAKSLGLTRPGKIKVLPLNNSVLGKLKKISFMVKILSD